MFKKNQLNQQKLIGINEKRKQPSGNFEDIMSKFLKDSEERMQDVKKHQEFKGKSGKKSINIL